MKFPTFNSAHTDPAYNRKSDWCNWKAIEDEIRRTGAPLDFRKATGAEIALLRKWFRRGFQSTSWNKKGVIYMYQKEGLDHTFWDIKRIQVCMSFITRATRTEKADFLDVYVCIRVGFPLKRRQLQFMGARNFKS